MSRNVQWTMSRVGSSLLTLAGVVIALCGICIAAGALLLALSPLSFISLVDRLPEAIQERLAMELFSAMFMGDWSFRVLLAIGLGSFVAWVGHKIVTR